MAQVMADDKSTAMVMVWATALPNAMMAMAMVAMAMAKAWA